MSMAIVVVFVVNVCFVQIWICQLLRALRIRVNNSPLIFHFPLTGQK
jgi:hypothetical protein